MPGTAKSQARDQFNLFQKGDQQFTSSYVGLRINVPIFLGMSNDANIKSSLTLKTNENRNR